MACVTVPAPSHLHIRVSEKATAVRYGENEGGVSLTECEGDGVTTLSSQVTSTLFIYRIIDDPKSFRNVWCNSGSIAKILDLTSSSTPIHS
jgi:hypothetical protein